MNIDLTIATLSAVASDLGSMLKEIEDARAAGGAQDIRKWAQLRSAMTGIQGALEIYKAKKQEVAQA